jgi:hypothetical protein
MHNKNGTACLGWLARWLADLRGCGCDEAPCTARTPCLFVFARPRQQDREVDLTLVATRTWGSCFGARDRRRPGAVKATMCADKPGTLYFARSWWATSIL